MMSENALNIISTITQEVMSALDLSGATTLANSVSAYQANRQALAREILMNRVADGEIDLYEAVASDELTGVIFTYMICANKGMARVNLDLLSQAIAGDLKQGSIHPDRFHKFLNLLASLTRDEILVIGTYIRLYKKNYEEVEKRNELFLGNVKHNAWNALMQELVPSVFPTTEHVSVICGSLMRTGITTTYMPQLGSSASHSFTVLLDEVSKMIDFEKAYKGFPEY